MLETEVYLKADLKALYEVVHKFAETLFNQYGVRLTESLTVPSLAMKVFRSNYLAEGMSIPYLSGKVDREIRQAYFGGIVAAVKPEIANGYYYDVNSSYPASMKMDLPVGSPTLVDITSMEGVFGFVNAQVTAPETTVNNILPLPMRLSTGASTFKHGQVATG